MKLLAASLALWLTACASSPKQATPPPAPPALPTSIEEAVNSAYRTPENRARDKYRHPAETLAFFGLKPEMTVIEIAPGTGWYMEILAPLMNANGKYIAAMPPSANSEYMMRNNQKVNDWIKARPELAAKVETVPFVPPADIGPADSADMVLTFRNVHNWLDKGSAQDAFKAFFRVLKPGGVLGVVEHRADAKVKVDPKAKSGYMREADVIQLAKKAGFQLAEKSEINANPKDTKDYPEGVWTLPPSLRLGDKDRQKYMDIGESDRMTLRFVKPAKKK